MNRYLQNIAQQTETSIFSLEFHFQSENNFNIYKTELKKKKKKVEFDCEEKAFQSVSELSSFIKKNQVICLSLTGRGIITKKIDKPDDFKFSLKHALPTINEDDFYYQVYDCENYLFITLIRRTMLNNVLEQIEKMKWQIDQIYLGDLTAFSIANILEQNTIQCNSSKLEIQNGNVYQVQPSIEKEQYLLDGKNILNSSVTSLGSGFIYFSQADLFSPINCERLIQNKENLQYGRLLNKIGFGSLAVLLLLLLFNQFVQSHYLEREVLLTEILSNTASERKQLSVSKIELEEKRKLLQSTGLFNPIKLSFYADQLGKEVPTEIILKDLAINPLEGKKTTEGEKAEFSLGTIQIKGSTSNTAVLNAWVKKVKSYSWSKEVTIDHYNQSGQQIEAEFILQIKVV